MNLRSVARSFGAWLVEDKRRFDLFVATLTVAFTAFLILGSPRSNDAGWPEAAAGVGAFVLLALRRRFPFVTLAIALVLAAGHVAIFDRPTPMILASIVLLASATVRLERWPAIALGAAIGLTLYVASLVTTGSGVGDDRSIIALVWAGMAVGVGDAVRSWRRYRESAEEQMRSALLAAEAQTRQQLSEERLNIARELHDLLAHNLSVMNVQTGAAMHLLHSDVDGAEAALKEARAAGRSVLDELRELLTVLRSSDEDDDDRTALPTIDDLPALVDRVRASGLRLEWHQTGTPGLLTPAVSLAAYRIVQEGLTNAAKHGDGSAELSTAWDDEAGLTVTIRSPIPVGTVAASSAPAGGLGLVGMRERATANGGTLDVSTDDGAFVVTARLPVAAGDRFEVRR